MCEKNLTYYTKELGYYLYAMRMQFIFTVFFQIPTFFIGFYFIGYWILLWTIPWTIAQLLDLKSRMKELFWIRSIVEKYPHKRDRYLKAQCFAPCRRNATAVAIRDIKYANDFYYNMGYRWYHLIPDGFFTKARTLKYWKAALFK